MKKYILSVLIIVNIILAVILGTRISKYKILSEDDKQYITKIQELKAEQSNIEKQINARKNELSNINKTIEDKKKVASGDAKYIMKINISQSHFSLSVSEHLKDEMNDIDIYIEVSEEYYNKYNVGDTIADDFRVGSMIFKGSFGNWKVKVSDKQIL